jgi:hypothetical protein
VFCGIFGCWDTKSYYFVEYYYNISMSNNIIFNSGFGNNIPDNCPEFMDQRYAIAQKASGIKIGDKVIVTKSAKSYDLGWGTTWESEMQKSIGSTFFVGRIDERYGMLLDNDLWYPFYVLKNIGNITSNDN